MGKREKGKGKREKRKKYGGLGNFLDSPRIALVCRPETGGGTQRRGGDDAAKMVGVVG